MCFFAVLVWWCFCGCFCDVALPRSCETSVSSFSHSHQTFPLCHFLHKAVFHAFVIFGVLCCGVCVFAAPEPDPPCPSPPALSFDNNPQQQQQHQEQYNTPAHIFSDFFESDKSTAFTRILGQKVVMDIRDFFATYVLMLAFQKCKLGFAS